VLLGVLGDGFGKLFVSKLVPVYFVVLGKHTLCPKHSITNEDALVCFTVNLVGSYHQRVLLEELNDLAVSQLRRVLTKNWEICFGESREVPSTAIGVSFSEELKAVGLEGILCRGNACNLNVHFVSFC
jgi:hypothetical protein